MNPSSTSSSSGPGPGRQWHRFAVTVLVLLGCVEAALRFPQVRSLLPPRTHYYHPAIAQRLDALEHVMMVHDRVDVLFIGSSIVLTNVHPLLFDQLMADQATRVVSFNAGLSGLWPIGVHLYAENLWLPTVRPRLLVQGVRYAELAATAHAKNETQVWTGRIEPSWRDSDLITRATAGAVSNVYLLQYRGAAVQLLERYRNGWIEFDDPDTDDTHAVRGYQPRGGTDTPVERWEPDLPNDGVCAGDRCDVGFEALRRTIAAARAAGSAYVLVNVPEHAQRWRTPGGVARYRHYVARLRDFAASEGVGFIDPTDGNPFRFEHTPYADLAHMTAAGSRQFTRALADRLGPIVTVTLANAAARRGRG